LIWDPEFDDPSVIAARQRLEAERRRIDLAERLLLVAAGATPFTAVGGMRVIEPVLWSGEPNPLVDRWRAAPSLAEREVLERLAAYGGTFWSEAELNDKVWACAIARVCERPYSNLTGKSETS
jgi:hypothetical protein